VLREFTSGRVAALEGEIAALCHALIDAFPPDPVDLVAAYAARVPVIVIARLLGVPDAACDRLLAWSHAMVAVYRPTVTRDEEEAADAAAAQFSSWLDGLLDEVEPSRRTGLLAALRAAEDAGRMTRAESVATAILLLNAGHEATVHALGLAAALLIRSGEAPALAAPGAVAATVEECLRLEAPLHVFTRWVHDEVEIAGHAFAPGDQLACLLAAGNRDPAAFPEPAAFRPGRAGPVLASFGAGTHFCLGAPLARLEMQVALGVLFARRPGLRLAAAPRIADIYHFRGYEALWVEG